ncbi:PKD domain-containing protein [Hymenobacter sp. BT175]|uniref:DUF7948 domain-containing protein n=1 Tax=Hymenobacter translucens TaxID=2886507 RepID=UPI001D0E6A18|nr:PKD domain-containing protein [Hymenobacter translucens]MCC2545739.1 PKD domain-containing protein [Hymenobacter translucens]
MPHFTLSERRLTGWSSVLGVVGLLAASPAIASSPSEKVVGPGPTRSMEFVVNRNQWPKHVLFATDVPGGRLIMEKGRLMQALYDVKAVEELHEQGPDGKDHLVKAHSYSVTFVGANQQAAVRGTHETGQHTNYFLGSDKSKWASKVPSFEEVRYEQLYPGTSLRFYTRDEHLEYDFELAAGADASRIRLRYDGQQQLRIVEGTLQIRTSVGTVTEQSPVAYQLVQGRRVPVPCRYVLGAGNVVSFAFPKGYNHAQPLVIDPVLVYSTFTGSFASNYGYTATYDDQGNLYAGGIVFDVGFPISAGAYNLNYEGSVDYGIMKFDPAATNRILSRKYGTYVGGSSGDHPHSMVVDPAGNLIILGSTASTNFPTTATAFDRTYNTGTCDIVVSKLSADGSQLLASTFLGGSGADGQLNGALDQNYNDNYRGDVTTDAQGNIYLASFTESNNFPAQNGFQMTKGGGTDGVVVKLNPNMSSLIWSNFLGGSGEDAAYSVQVDSTGTTFVGGGTNSTNFPGTSGGLHPTSRGGIDGFVARIAPSGNDLFQSTYLGTSAYDQAYFVQLDRRGDVYAYGQTLGSYPVSTGVYSNPGSRQFLHKINRALTSTFFSTVVGNGTTGTGLNLSPTAFLVDNCGQILLSGFGGNIANMPITPDAIQTGATGTSGQFGYHYIMQLSPNAGRLVYGTYFGNGGSHVDGGTSRFDKKGIIYQSMCISGPGLPVTPNAWSAVSGGGYNNAAFKIDILKLVPDFVQSNTPAGSRLRTGCAPLTVFFRRPAATGTNVQWEFGDGGTSTSTGTVTRTYATPGRYFVRLTVSDVNSCQPPVSAVDTIDVFGFPTAAAGPDKSICQGTSVQLAALNALAGNTYTWSPATGLSGTSGPIVTASPAVTTTYYLDATTVNGCSRRDTVVVTVVPKPQVALSASTLNEFTNKDITFTNTTLGATTYQWNFGDGETSTAAAPTHSYARPGEYRVRLTASAGVGCLEFKELLITIRQFELPNVITPNNDGLNDTFKPFVAFQPVDIKVFNRWGKQVYAQENYLEGWGKEGTPPGIYYYQLVSRTGETWKGWVEVAR